MTHTAKIGKQGNSVGVIIPKPVLEASGLARGDEVTISHAGQGRIEIRPAGSDYNREMELARAGMDRYAKALAKLAE